MKIPSSKQHVIIIFILLLALYVRLLSVSNMRIPVADSGDYLELAYNISHGKGYTLSAWWTYYGEPPSQLTHPDVSRQPLFPYLSAILFYFFTPSFTLIQYFNVCLGVFNVFLIYLIGKKYFSYLIAFLSATCVAINPVQIWFSSQAYAENLFTFLFYILVLIMRSVLENERNTCFLAGILLGLLYLTRLNGVFIIVAFFASLLIPRCKPAKLAFINLAIILGLLIFVVSPWLTRNFLIFDNPFKTGGAYMNWVDSFQEMHSLKKTPPSFSSYYKTHTSKQMFLRYIRGLMRSSRGILVGNINYNDPYKQGSFAIFFIFSLFTVYYQLEKKYLFLIYFSFSIHFLAISWTLLGIFRYLTSFYPLMILLGITGMFSVAGIISSQLFPVNRQHIVKYVLLSLFIFIGLIFSFQPFFQIFHKNDHAIHGELMECVQWIKDNTDQHDIIMDYPILVEMIYMYNRETAMVPTGSIVNLLNAIEYVNAKWFVASAELVYLRPEYRKFFQVRPSGELQQIRDLPRMTLAHVSSGNRFFIYEISGSK